MVNVLVCVIMVHKTYFKNIEMSRDGQPLKMKKN